MADLLNLTDLDVAEMERVVASGQVIILGDIAQLNAAREMAKTLDVTNTIVIDSISDILKEMVIFESQMDYLEARQKATKPFDRHTGMNPHTINQSRPVGRPMRSVNRNR